VSVLDPKQSSAHGLFPANLPKPLNKHMFNWVLTLVSPPMPGCRGARWRIGIVSRETCAADMGRRGRLSGTPPFKSPAGGAKIGGDMKGDAGGASCKGEKRNENPDHVRYRLVPRRLRLRGASPAGEAVV